MPERELQDITDENAGTGQAVAEEVGTCIIKKLLFFPGTFLSVFGFGGSLLDFNFKFLNRFLHLGKWKWILQSGFWVIGIIGLVFIYYAFPNLRSGLCSVCKKRALGKQGRRYERLLNDANVERGRIPNA